jgi:hypothetical protein
MRKIILLIALALVGTMAFGQYYHERNIVAFGGYLFEPSNSQNNGHYYGLYADWQLFRRSTILRDLGDGWMAESSDGSVWTVGPYVVVNRSAFYQSLNRYSGKILEAGGGMIVGYYKGEFTNRHSLFIGSSLGAKYAWDNGEGRLSGLYEGRQRDLLLAVNLNINLLKSQANDRLLPRTQVVVTYQKPFSKFSSKFAAWNDSEIPGQIVWDKTYLEIVVRQSIYDISLSKYDDLFLSPKLIGLYSYSTGNKEKCVGLGGEVSLHRPGRDDYFTLFCLYKQSELKNVLIIGASVNLVSMFKRW